MTRTERQLLAIENWKKAGGRATIVAATGTGKTRIAVMTIQRVLNKAPTCNVVVIVPTKALYNQWVGILKEWNLSQVVIKIINTASMKVFNCDFLVCDEIHRFVGCQFRKVFKNCNPKLIMGLTATYERLDGKEKEVLDKYCPVCDIISLEEALENGWLAVYKEYKVMLDVDLTEYNKANQAFIQHFSFFDFNWDSAVKALSDIFYQQKLAKQMNCALKEVKAHAYAWNKALQFRKSFIANHPKKLEIAKKILNARKTSKAITFNSSIKQCEAYGFGYVVHSGNGKKKNQMTLEEFAKQGPGSVIHSSKMLIEGLDCPGLNLAIITGFNSSKINRVQSRGRCIRQEPGKEAEIFILILKGTVEAKWDAKASEDSSYIEINEEELTDILNHKSLNKTIKKGDKYNGIRY